jgi:hypothetical protein
MLALKNCFVPHTLLLLVSFYSAAAQEFQTSVKLIDELIVDSQKHAKQRVEYPKRDAIRLAESCADLLAEDVPSYTERLGDVVLANLKAGRTNDAQFLSEKMRQLGNESGFLGVMMDHLHASRRDEALALIPDIQKSLSRLSLVRRRVSERDIAICQGLLAEKSAKLEDLEKLEPDIRLEVETEWLKSGKHPQPPLTLDAVKTRINKEVGGPLASAHFVVVALEKILPKLPDQDVLPFIEYVGSFCTETHHPGAHHAMLDLAKVLWQHQTLRTQARKAMTRYLEQSASYPEQAEWKGPYFADAVPVLLEWEEKDLAKKAAKDAREKLDKVFVADVAHALIAAARAAHLVGLPAERDQALVDAVAVARRYPHPRVGANAAVECCLLHAELELQLSDSVYKQLSGILHLDESVTK